MVTLAAMPGAAFAERHWGGGGGDGGSSSGTLTINSASWSSRRARLSVSGDGRSNATVTVSNADTAEVIGSDGVNRRGSWSLTVNNPARVPCRVRAVQSDGQTAERNVSGAPANCDSGSGGANTPPVANANGPYSGTTGQSISFSSAGSNDPDGSIASYAWNFGDGSGSSQANPSHTYATAGSYNVTLTVTDNDGATASDSTSATVSNPTPANQPPVAHANGPYSGTTGQSINFSSAGSNDPDGSIVSYAWNFGDGSGSSQANPSHAYATAGSYNVTLTVTDNDGATATDITSADIQSQAPTNVPPTANANGPYIGTTGQSVVFSSAGSSDSDGSIVAYAWNFGDGGSSNQANPSHAYSAAGNYNVTLTVTDNDGATGSDTTSASIQDQQPVPNVSINSTSQTGVPGSAVPEQPFVNQSGYRVFAVNDLGMHCGDFDTRISSILPPFNVMHATVIQRGLQPRVLGPGDGVDVYYSAASNPNDPILTGVNSAGSGPVYSSMVNGIVFKTNFWDVARQAYDAFYPPGILPVFYPAGPVSGILDLGLPMPNVEQLYLGNGALTADQQTMPGRDGPYIVNTVTPFMTYITDQAFFIDAAFQFGYVSEGVNWYEAPGVPASAFDDFGRENPWPLFRVQAKMGGTVLASIDTVVPISGEANCGACHNAPVDGGNGSATAQLEANGNMSTVLDDPELGAVPLEVSKEYSADLNLIRLHDLKNGTDLESQTPVVCQQCHYTPALDLAQVGPMQGAVGSAANGRMQNDVKSMSNVMHSHHASVTDTNGNLLFPSMPAAIKDDFGFVTNADQRHQVLEETCYQCHPGRRTDCLRGAMANGGMVCQDCHGNMAQVGNDFTRTVSASSPGSFELGGDFYTNSNQPRVPWANEPGCGSCHTGDAMSNLAGTTGTVVNHVDAEGNPDNIRLFQAYRTGDAKATPIVPTNKRFAENVIAADNPAVTGSNDPRIGNPMLYRISKGHEGVFCEACHGSTHGIWPNKNDLANDNVAATQLQGHKGVVSECSTCHEGDLGTTLGGPHGMHPVGNTRFSNGGHENFAQQNRDACRACHGRNGEGSVLSRAFTDRTLSAEGRTVRVNKGDMITCSLCHSNQL